MRMGLSRLAVDAAVVSEFVAQTGWGGVLGEWDEQERRRIDDLATEKYRRDHWNRRR